MFLTSKTNLSTLFIVLSLGARAETCNVGLPAQHLIPIPNLGTQLYLGQFQGLLYDGSNNPPPGHDADGKTFASKITPRNTNGIPAANGVVIFLSIGFSNNDIQFCGGNSFFNNDPEDPRATVCPAPVPLKPTPCTIPNCPYNQVESFMGQAFTDTTVVHNGPVVLADGALGGKTLDKWDPFTDIDPGCSGFPCYAEYERVKGILQGAGFSEKQVQSIWVKSADADPTKSLKDGSSADAYAAESHLGNIMRAIRLRYPNARQVFISPRTYGGFANVAGNPLNKEPYAYELGFAIKWLIAAQINEMNGGATDLIAGDLRYSLSPGNPPSTWIDWGPYLWADAHACPLGYPCIQSDFRGPGDHGPNECTHPSTHGEQKVGKLLLDFVKGSPYTTWFYH